MKKEASSSDGQCALERDYYKVNYIEDGASTDGFLGQRSLRRVLAGWPPGFCVYLFLNNKDKGLSKLNDNCNCIAF